MKIQSIPLMLLHLLVSLFLISGCQTNPRSNVVGYIFAEESGLFAPYESNKPNSPTGSITGRVIRSGGITTTQGIAGATVIIAERSGIPHSAQTDANGRYQINNIPAGQYVPAAIALGFEENALHDQFGIPTLITVQADSSETVPDIVLSPKQPLHLPQPLASSVNLTTTAIYSATAPFPQGAAAWIQTFTYEYNGATIDTLRLYTPLQQSTLSPSAGPRVDLPMLFMVYPTYVDLWQTVSVAYAAQGYAVVAISPVADRLLDIEAHALDAIVGLTLAQSGALGSGISDQPAVALGGSFSSAVLNRIIQNLASGTTSNQRTASQPTTSQHTIGQIAALITVGGIGNAFDGASEFYAGNITVPIGYEYAIPALGPPHIIPLTFLRYSPVYAASQFPPTLIIHTAADTVIPIQQAYELEAALRTHDIPVDVFYYEDVSHYLQIDENLTDAGAEMFYHILDYTERFSQ